jgi:hypothetical protein
MNSVATIPTALSSKRPLIRLAVFAAVPLLWVATPQTASAAAHSVSPSTIQITAYSLLCGCTNLFVPVDYMCASSLSAATDVVVQVEQAGAENQGRLSTTVYPSGSTPPPFTCDGKKHSQYIEVSPSNAAFETGSAVVTAFIAQCDVGCTSVSGGASVTQTVKVKPAG